MAKRRKERRRGRPSGSSRRVLRRDQVSINQEARHIVECAQRGDARVVTLGALVFFSTAEGDAWVLDPGDHLALCLARGGEQLPWRIIETEQSFAIEWAARYAIGESGFVVEDLAGMVSLFPGYPVAHILDGERRVRGQG